MTCLDQIDQMVVAVENGWPLGIKALQTLRAQIVLDVAACKQACVIALEAKAPHIIESLEVE